MKSTANSVAANLAATAITTVPDRFVDETEAADILGLKPQTLSVWRLKGRGPKFCKIGKCVRYRLSALFAYADARTVSSTNEADQLAD